MWQALGPFMRFISVIALVLGMATSGVQAGGMSDTRIGVTKMPDTLEYAFGHEYVLMKHPSGITLSWRPQWTDAQTAPPPSFDERRHTVKLNEVEFSRIWTAISSVNFAPLRAPIEADFVRSPPDMYQTETLRYVVDGAKLVDWQRDSAFLRAALREPLLSVARILREVFEQAGMPPDLPPHAVSPPPPPISVPFGHTRGK